ncbi:MAG: hypothetical protein QW775_08190 [Ignisphaera sp.]|uniref:Uncharacterized protein n=1 Tax=Ignisphaera aggregans TaxID=334771 RepID=A0A7C4NLL7_9CREN
MQIQDQNSIEYNHIEKELAVWEEALLQEFLYAIGHLNHVEQHLLESDAHVGSPAFGDLIDSFREQRKLVGQVMFLVENIEAAKVRSQDIRSSWESIWCALKHATTALIHIDECVEKLLKKLKESKNDEVVNCIKTLLKVRENVLKGVINMIQRGKVVANLLTEASIRCREDLCLEEVEKH